MTNDKMPRIEDLPEVAYIPKLKNLLDEALGPNGPATGEPDPHDVGEEPTTTWDAEARAARERPKEPSPFHVMVDIETFGTGPAAFPIAIGAVKFDPNDNDAGDGERDRFYVAIDPRLGPALGIDIPTVMWWMEPEQRESLDRWLNEPKQGLVEALDGFAQWYGDESLPTWTRGPAFDAVILETAYKVCGFPRRPWAGKNDPVRLWHFRQDRDCRTIRGLMPRGWKAPSEGQGKHNALDDAIYQTHELLTIARELGLTLR